MCRTRSVCGRDVYSVCAATIKNALPTVLAFVEQSELAVPAKLRGGGAFILPHGRPVLSPHRPAPSVRQSSPRYGGGLRKVDPEIFDAIAAEEKRQRENIELIASENFTSRAVMEAQGSVPDQQIRRRLSGETLVWRLRERRRGRATGHRSRQAAFRLRTRQRPAAQRRAGEHGRLFLRAEAGRQNPRP